MHRPSARRARRLAGALIVALVAVTTLTACGDDDADDDVPVLAPKVVVVAAQPCSTPNEDHGVGVVVLPGFVATAAHVVDGPRRSVTVAGQPAEVVAIDARTDLALLATDIAGAFAPTTSTVDGPAIVRTPDGDLPVDVSDTGQLTVDDTTDHEAYEREVHTFAPGVADGTSGSALLDPSGRLAGIVVLANRTDDTGYAVTATELWRFVSAVSTGDRAPAAPEECPD